MSKTIYVIFKLDEQLFAIPASAVDRVIRAVQPAIPLDAPDLLYGLINMGGQMIALVDIRKQFGMAERPIQISDRIIIVHISGQSAAFAVDAVIGVHPLQPNPAVGPEYVYPDMQDYVSGIACFDNQTAFIHDIQTLIPQTTIDQVQQVLETAE